MDAESKADIESKVPRDQGVPDELVDHLHDANERLHRCKEHLEEEINANEYRHQERVNQATNEIRDAEREIEEVTQKITDSLHVQP